MRNKLTLYALLSFFTLSVIILSCSDDEQTASPITLAEATHKVLTDVLDNDFDSLLFYRHPEKITSGTEFRYYPSGEPDPAFIVDEASWFFFVDDVPGARWAHPCRWILVAENGGAVQITDEEWPPGFFDEMEMYYTLDTATKKVVASIMFDSLEYKDLYYSTNLIAAGQAITNPTGGNYTAPANSWFFFIDDLPQAFYAHDCRYVFIEVWGGADSVINEQWPPDIHLEMYD